ncbi:MAG: mechanosensitive ion channel domain-containing protein [Bacteroidaceae bacterium]
MKEQAKFAMTYFNKLVLNLFDLTSNHLNQVLAQIVTVFCLFLFAYLCNWTVRFILINGLTKIIRATKFRWDDVLLDHGVLIRLSKMVAPVIIYLLLPFSLSASTFWYTALIRLSSIYIMVNATFVLNAFLKAIFELYSNKEKYKNRPIKGLLQIMQIILILIATVVSISILVDRSPVTLLTAMGASAAIIMLLFKDSIMGFVAGIQLAANDMVNVGDWIEVPSQGVNGMILEVNLNTVKVQNWDNTIITVPPYALVSEGLINWKGMSDGGGRRIKRHITIDQSSVDFCTPEMLEKYSKISILKDYIENTEKQLKQYNEENKVDNTILVNGKRQTNLGVFRVYLDNYLKLLPEVNHEMTCMVRQLQPTNEGLPIELYFFSRIKDWVAYEQVQSDVFDHVLAVVPQFDLRIAQNPIGSDIREAIKRLK